MAKKMDLFYIFKLNVSTIIDNNYDITTTFDEAKRKGWVVSVGDNQILKFIRDIKCIDFEKQKDKLEKLYKKRNDLKSLPKSYENSKKIQQYQQQIDDILYVPDLVSVHANTTKKDYNSVAKNYFKVNGITYKRLCAGAGQLRRNTVIFVNEKLYSQLETIMLCGLDKNRIGNINLAKFSAYYSLYSSSNNFITTPRVCVVPDYEFELKNQKVEWIFTNENGERCIETRTINILQNVFDGSGLVSLEMAQKWNEDLELDYSPSAYIIRSAWIKGLCIVFDWKRFARDVAKKEYIVDAWGNKKHIDDVDVILSTSQFKMWKKYENWEEYVKYHTEYGHVWGCSRVNKKQDNYLTTLNYQYVQSNSFTEESIKKLADFSIDWIKKVCTGDRIYVLLYLLGCHESDKDIEDVENQTGLSIAKALMYNKEILNDKYVRDRVYRSIQKRINQIKIGKLLVEGSYEFAMVDPYMYCQHVFDMGNKDGLLKANQLWQRRWVDKGAKEVALMRSPLVSPHENNVLQVYSDEECEKWFGHIASGVILNGWDTSLMRASDGDVDGDLLLTTDNKYLVDAVDRTLLPITYEKSSVKEQPITYKNLYIMDTKSFNTKIGFITNLATTFICLRNQYDKDSPEYKELTKRINLLRFHQGSAIDAGKGNVYIPPPRHWSKRMKIDFENDSEEVRQQKYWNNKLVGDRKSYFMCYIYPSLMEQFKQYKTQSEQSCRINFSCRLNDLFKKPNKTKQEKKFISNYFRYVPALINKSILNQLCWHVENVDFDLRFYKQQTSFDYKVLMNSKYKINTNSDLYKKIRRILKKYYYIYEMNINEKTTMAEELDYLHDEEDHNQEISILFDEVENELFTVCSNRFELCNYIAYIMYNEFKNKSKAIMWNICGNEIVENLKSNGCKAVFPIEATKDDGVEYLGKFYKLQEVNLDSI